VADPTFRPDLYRGAGREYDRFRLPYPQSLTADLAGRVGADGAGRLLDLACGTGQITFAMRADFAQTWAVDQEPDMIDVVRAKAAGLGDVHTEVCAAEDLVAPADSFDLVGIGNAFHRLRRTARSWRKPASRSSVITSFRRRTRGPRTRWSASSTPPPYRPGAPWATGRSHSRRISGRSCRRPAD
jgi:SAM-dependent methyltransferase